METQTKTLQTVLHCYWLDISQPQGREGYEQMKERIKANSTGRGHWMNCISMNRDGRSWGDGDHTVTLETKFLFENQWNTSDDSPAKPNARVFDWYEEITPNRSIKVGHWLEITPEMVEIRQSTLVCGYCGKHYPDGKPGFCSACLDSPYLKVKQLHLLRLLPVFESFGAKRAELAEQEKAELMPLYVKRQTTGNESRAVKARKDKWARVEEHYTKGKAALEEEYQGMKWLHEHNVNLENVIYYSHTRRFAFGWQSPIEPEVKSKLLDILCEFPFDYDFSEPRKL